MSKPIWRVKEGIQVEHGDDAVVGLSPIPVIWVIGGPETGKTTFAATVDPVRPGNPPRTRILDLEQSATTIRRMMPLEVVDIRALAEAKINRNSTGKGTPIQLAIFETVIDYLDKTPAGDFTVLAFDPSSDFKLGANMWTKKHAELFGKSEAAYNGKDGTVFSWGDTKVFLKDMMTRLAAKYHTIVLTSHENDEFKGGVRTGNKEFRSADFTEIATLSLWLQIKKSQAGIERHAVVHKSRLSWLDWGDEGEERDYPALRDLLPRKLVPQYVGQSYPELINHYLGNPQRDYGVLNDAADPSKREMSADERAAMDTAAKQAEGELMAQKLMLETQNGKVRLIAQLKELGITKSGAEIAVALGELGEAYSLAKHEVILAKLKEKLGGAG